MIFNNKKNTVSFSLTSDSIKEFRKLLNTIKKVSLEEDIKNFFGNSRNYESLLELLNELGKQLNYLTRNNERTALGRNETMKNIYLIIKSIESLVVKRGMQIKGIKKEKFFEHYQNAQPLALLLKDLIGSYLKVLAEILNKDHEFIAHLEEISTATENMEKEYSAMGGPDIA